MVTAMRQQQALLARPVVGGLSSRNFGNAQTFLDEKEVADRVLQVVKNFEKVEPGKVTAAARFKEDLSLDSLDVVEVVMAIEEEFALEIPDNEADKIASIGDAIKYITSHPQAK